MQSVICFNVSSVASVEGKRAPVEVNNRKEEFVHHHHRAVLLSVGLAGLSELGNFYFSGLAQNL